MIIKEKRDTPFTKQWNTLEIEPPNEIVEVEDKNGNTALAMPTYYPFKIGKNNTGKKWILKSPTQKKQR